MKFKYDDLFNLSLVLENGMKFKEAFEIIKDTKNKIIISKLFEDLDNGFKIEDVIIKYVDKNISLYINSFINYLPFEKTLNLSLSLIDKSKQMKQFLLKSISYPLLLIVLCIGGIYIFNNLFFYQMIEMISGFNLDLSRIFLLKNILDWIINLILLIILLFFIIFKFSINDKSKIFFYLKINKLFKNNIYKTYITHLFVIFYIECLKQGLKTKECIEILLKIKHIKYISFLAYHIDDNFNKGFEYSDALTNLFIDQKLKKFLKVSKFVENKINVLEMYLKINQKLFYSYVKKLGIFLQISSYCLVFLVVYFIYNLLLMPIGIMERF